MAPCSFTIILPVHNGGEFLKLCVQSILAQTVEDFQLQILENASDDGSREWLESLKDPRISIWPSDRLLPIQDNWGRALQIPKQEFLTFVGHDDLWDPHFLSVVSDLIHSHPEASLYHTHFRLIDQAGKVLGACPGIPVEETAAQYLEARFRFKRLSYGTGFVMRSQCYEAVGGIPLFEKLLFADDALWILMMQGSRKITSPQTCFSYRAHSQSTAVSSDWNSQLQALGRYNDFLVKMTMRNDGIREVYNRCAPSYFFRYHRFIYLTALVAACRNNQVLGPRVKEEIQAALGRTAPSMVPKFSSSLAARFFELANRSPLRKGAVRAWHWGRAIDHALGF